MLLVFAIGGVFGAAVTIVVMLLRQGQAAAETTRLQVDAARLGAELDATRQSLDGAAGACWRRRRRSCATALRRSRRDALKENRADFLHSADALLAPVRDALGKVQTQLIDVDKAREGCYPRRARAARLARTDRRSSCAKTTESTLTRSLRSPNVRGKWGEIQLRRIVELAGMLEQCDFVEKSSATTEDGSRQTPDLDRQPAGRREHRHRLEGADRRVSSRRPTPRRTRHARSISRCTRARCASTCGALGAKEYWKQFQPAPEFVVMFLPLGAAAHGGVRAGRLAARLRGGSARDSGHADDAARAAHAPWPTAGKQQQLANERGGDPADRPRRSTNGSRRWSSTSRTWARDIKQAADSYDRFVGSLEPKVLPGARRFKELGVSSAKELEMPEPLRLSPRTVQRDELKTPGPSEPQ